MQKSTSQQQYTESQYDDRNKTRTYSKMQIKRTEIDEQPLVSVITPMYNAERYISQAITSCLNQTYKNWELVIIDDCSIDQSVTIARQFTDSRVRIFKMAKNSGPGAARNFGLLQARGEWITVLDADDAFRTHRISAFVKMGLELGNHKVIYDKPVEWNGPVDISPKFLETSHRNQVPKMSNIVLENWIASIGYSTPFFHRSLLGENTRYPEDIRGPEDTVFFIRLCVLNHAGLVETNTQSYVYRRLEGSLSNRGATQLDEINKSIEIMRPLSKIRPEITNALNTLLKHNNVNLLAAQLRLFHKNKEFYEIWRILRKQAPLIPSLFHILLISLRSKIQAYYSFYSRKRDANL